MRGTLVPSLKVARTASNWFSMPQMPPLSGADVQLALEFAAAEGGVALRVDRLVQFKRAGRIGRADAGDILAGVAGEAADK